MPASNFIYNETWVQFEIDIVAPAFKTFNVFIILSCKFPLKYYFP